MSEEKNPWAPVLELAAAIAEAAAQVDRDLANAESWRGYVEVLEGAAKEIRSLGMQYDAAWRKAAKIEGWVK